MQYLRNFSQQLLFNKISPRTTFVRYESELESWIDTAVDLITCRPASEQDKSKHKPTSVIFAPNQRAPSERKLGKLIAANTKSKQIFYGIEMAAHSFSIPLILDYNQFSKHMPLFTALIWLGKEYGPVVRLTDVDMILFALKLQPHTIVLPHFVCNGADVERLSELLDLDFQNIFVVRGNQPAVQNQTFPETADLVRAIRRKTGGVFDSGRFSLFFYS